MKKYYNENNEFAVLVSYGYGAGWSTWTSMKPHDGEFVEFLFDNGFINKNKYGDLCVGFKTSDIEKIKLKCKELCGEDYIYLGGLYGSIIEWIKEGVSFKIKEYDGSESIEYRGSSGWNY